MASTTHVSYFIQQAAPGLSIQQNNDAIENLGFSSVSLAILSILAFVFEPQWWQDGSQCSRHQIVTQLNQRYGKLLIREDKAHSTPTLCPVVSLARMGFHTALLPSPHSTNQRQRRVELSRWQRPVLTWRGTPSLSALWQDTWKLGFYFQGRRGQWPLGRQPTVSAITPSTSTGVHWPTVTQTFKEWRTWHSKPNDKNHHFHGTITKHTSAIVLILRNYESWLQNCTFLGVVF